MDLIGYDNDFSVNCDQSAVISRFVDGLSHLWPYMRGNVWDSESNLSTVIDGYLDAYPENGCLSVVKNKAMETHQIRYGGTLMKNGEGPLLLWFWYQSTGCSKFDLITPADASKDPFSRKAVLILIDAIKEFRLK